MFPANLSWMEQTEVIGTRKWGQVLSEDSMIERKKEKKKQLETMAHVYVELQYFGCY